MKFKILFFSIFFTLIFTVLISNEAQAFDMPTITQSNANTQCWCVCQPIEPEAEDAEQTDSEESNEELAGQSVDTEVTVDVLPGDVLISEFVADPVIGQDEWIEIFNATDQEIDLTGWVLSEGAGQSTVLSQTIMAQEYLVIEKSGLNNGGDQIILKNQNQLIIDQVTYGQWDDGNISDNAPSAEDPYSVIRLDLENEQNIDSLDFAVTVMITAGQENIYEPLIEETEDSQEGQTGQAEQIEEDELETDQQEDSIDEENVIEYDFSDQIIINEIFPNPSGSDTGGEWIELYNSGDENVNLNAWSIDDEAGGSSPYKISEDLVIKAKDYLVLSNEQTKIILNNTTDKCRLFDPEDKLIDEISYEQVKEDQSYSLIENVWQWTTQITPGEENLLAEEVVENNSGLIKIASAAETSSSSKDSDSVIKTTIEQARNLPLGTKVQVAGEVSAKPGVFSDQYMYLSGSGMQVYFSKKDWPDIDRGDLVQVTGKLSESRQETRILIKEKQDVVVMQSEYNQVKSRSVTSEEIGEELEGWLVQIEGDLVDKKSSTLTLADEFGEYIVYLKQNTGLSGSIFNVGERLKITGIVTQYDDQYRIMPRDQQDVVNVSLQSGPIIGQVVQAKEVDMVDAEQADNGSKSWVVALVFALGALGYVLWKYKEKLIVAFQRIKMLKK